VINKFTAEGRIVKIIVNFITNRRNARYDFSVPALPNNIIVVLFMLRMKLINFGNFFLIL
ncbi:MAG: hypothetical protein ACK55I_47845, partial [bacterium]